MRPNDMQLSSCRRRYSTYEATAWVGKVLVGQTGVGQRLHTDQAVLRLKEDLDPVRHIACHRGRQPIPRLTRSPLVSSSAMRRAMIP